VFLFISVLCPHGPSDSKISNKRASTIEGLMELSDYKNINKSRTAIDVTESKLGIEN